MKNKIKIVIDILMFVITLLLMNINTTGHLTHEVLGITITILIILHLILNFKWIKNVGKNLKKTTLKTKMQYCTDIFTFIFYFLAIIFGILISTKIFNFSTNGDAYIMLCHHIFGRLAIIMMTIHIGFHLNMIITTKNKNIKTIIYIVYIIISLAFTIYLIYNLTENYVWKAIMHN